MSNSSGKSFADTLDAILAEPSCEFTPSAYYDKDGDCIEFIARPEPFYGKRIDELVTVYLSQESDEVVGALVKGVAAYCSKMSKQNPAFAIVIDDGRIKMGHLFLSRALEQAPMEQMHITLYSRLISVADETGVTAEGVPCEA